MTHGAPAETHEIRSVVYHLHASSYHGIQIRVLYKTAGTACIKYSIVIKSDFRQLNNVTKAKYSDSVESWAPIIAEGAELPLYYGGQALIIL